MKIAIIAAFYPPQVRGGGEISAELLVEILSAAGADVSVLTCGFEASVDTDSDAYIERVKSPNLYWNFDTPQSPIKKFVWHLRENFNPNASRVVKRFLKAVEPDIVVTSTIQNFGAAAWTAPSELGLPIVHILRSYYPFCWRSSAVKNNENCAGNCVDCALLTYGRRRASQAVSGVIGISNYVLERHLREGVFEHADTVVIPEPVSEAQYTARSRTSHAARFGFLGMLSSDKGLDTLAAAWDAVPAGGASLAIAGRGEAEYATSIRSRFRKDVDFVGWVDSVSFFETIDYLIVPSIWHEPFGRIVVEAFARGIPVIGSRIGGIAESIVDGRNGFLFEPRDASDLAAHVRAAAQLPQDAYATLSRNALLDGHRYEAGRVASEHMDFYSRIVGRTHE